MPSSLTAPARAGDKVEVVGHRVGETHRRGTILEVVGDPEHPRYRVAWEDGHETVLTPGGDLRVTRARRKKQ